MEPYCTHNIPFCEKETIVQRHKRCPQNQNSAHYTPDESARPRALQKSEHQLCKTPGRCKSVEICQARAFRRVLILHDRSRHPCPPRGRPLSFVANRNPAQSQPLKWTKGRALPKVPSQPALPRVVAKAMRESWNTWEIGWEAKLYKGKSLRFSVIFCHIIVGKINRCKIGTEPEMGWTIQARKQQNGETPPSTSITPAR